ncbi:MAG: ABC transporter permease, partial [Acidobacteria bacterium]|nr:ABC transporter permease [Acidobacteriota bacterium]
LGVRPALGRLIADSDASAPGREPVAVISHALWMRRFAGSPATIGQPIRINGQQLTIVGVLPDAFQGTTMGLQLDAYVPATMLPLIQPGGADLGSRTARGFALLGRLAPGLGDADAASELEGRMQQLAAAYPESNANVSASIVPLWQAPRGPQRLITQALLALQGLMLLVWLAVCGNAATLLLARVSARQKDVAIRLAIGATPWAIRRWVLAEAAVLGVIAGVVGTVLAIWGTRSLVVLPMTSVPVRFQTELDWGGVAFGVGLGLASGLIAGAGPAWQMSRLDPQVVWRSGARQQGRGGMRHALMAIQVALAVVVLVVAGLFLKSFEDAQAMPTGFARDGVVIATFDQSGRPLLPGEATQTVARLLETFATVPEFESAAVSSSVPLDIHGLPPRSFSLEGRTRADGLRDQSLSNIVTPNYFATLKIPIVAGRDFAPLIDVAAPPQVVVNEAFVERFGDGPGKADAILGKRVNMRGREFTIVGVVATTIADAFGERPAPQIFLSYRDVPATQGEIHVRTEPGSESAAATAIRRAARAADADLPVFNVRTMNQHVETNLIFRRIPARLFMVLGPLLLLLVAAGVYALVSYATTQRAAETGIRIALGASSGQVVGDAVMSSMRVVVAGLAVGWVLVFVAIRLLMPAAGTSAFAWVGVPVLVLALTGVASWWPARRLARVDPAVACRQG